MVRPGHRTHHPLPARAILPRDPARRTAQPEGTRGRYERGLVSQTPPHLQRYTRRCTATLLAGTGFCHVPPSRQGEETLPSAPGRHYLCALPRCLMAKVELRAPNRTQSSASQAAASVGTARVSIGILNGYSLIHGSNHWELSRSGSDERLCGTRRGYVPSGAYSAASRWR